MKKLALVCLVIGLTVIWVDAQKLPRVITRSTADRPVDNTPGADVTAPSVTITTPATDPFDAGTTTPQTVSGTASDAVGVVTVTYLNALTGVEDSCTGTTSWSCSIAMAVGTNMITITAADAALNEGTDTVDIEYDTGGGGECQHCVFSTSFTVAEGWSQDVYQAAPASCTDPQGFSGNQTNVSDWGAWTTAAGGCDAILTAANHAAGAGGRGFRHVRGDGVNNNGSALRIDFPSASNEVWIRWYQRYESGFTWGGSGNSKEIYVNAVGSSNSLYFGLRFLTHQAVANGFPIGSGAWSWSDMNGGSTADGNWHLMEVYLKADTDGTDGVFTHWIDGTQRETGNTYNMGGGTYSWFLIGSNQNAPNNGGDEVTDYDDIAVSFTQQIGAI